VAQEALQPLRHRDSALSNQELSLVSTAATRNGTVAAVVTTVVTGGAVAAANAFSPRFRSMFGVSGKLALIVTPSLGAFFLRSQQTINQALHDADGFIAPHLAAETVAAPIFHREHTPLQVAANVVYTHPFKTIMSIAGPIYGALFYRESTHPSTAHMPLSQRLIHTRVYGQMVAVLSTVAVMGFAKTMEGSGGIYRVEDAQLVRGEQLRNRRPFYEIGIGSATPQEKEVRQLQEEQRSGYEQGRKDSFDLLVPLLYAPMLPLMRILGRGRVAPERLNMMLLGTIGLALSHAGYIMFSDSTVLVKKDD
jgi:hypothetical protein